MEGACGQEPRTSVEPWRLLSLLSLGHTACIRTSLGFPRGQGARASASGWNCQRCQTG